MSSTETAIGPVLVAPDKFKGTFSASEVAAAIAGGLAQAGLATVELAIADGGEGTMEALVNAHGGEIKAAQVSDPLGRNVSASFALVSQHTAIVEAAQASGLWRVDAAERDPWAASTRGTGELIASAVEAGAKTVIVAVGGSATTDGGEGALTALSDAGTRCKIKVACDVRSKWEEAPRLYGPQKGADDAMIAKLEQRLDRLAERLPKDPRGIPLTGCAGGLSGALWASRDAELVPGADLILDAVGFDEHMQRARFVVTGEGRLDRQTLAGKAVGEVATRCRQAGVACHAVVAVNEMRPFDVRLLDLASVREATTLDELRECGAALATPADDGGVGARDHVEG